MLEARSCGFPELGSEKLNSDVRVPLVLHNLLRVGKRRASNHSLPAGRRMRLKEAANHTGKEGNWKDYTNEEDRRPQMEKHMPKVVTVQ